MPPPSKSKKGSSTPLGEWPHPTALHHMLACVSPYLSLSALSRNPSKGLSPLYKFLAQKGCRRSPWLAPLRVPERLGLLSPH